ncbi:hypothetical protein [Halobacillus sp. Marseille-Q1614]|uniref:hypothetical protein n=1 Tax=Halobacillus sp. Marseille-Q1614 TaxID=2709134 RepID=UPI001570053B|nr:hypothetical protein [Halobacillus sp. Marseille-Q1614]
MDKRNYYLLQLSLYLDGTYMYSIIMTSKEELNIRIYVLLGIVLLLSACLGQETLRFEGESDHWKVNYQAEIQGEDKESASFTMHYIGGGEPPEEIDCNINAGEETGHNVSLEKGVLESSRHPCSGCSITRENQEFDVTIEWDDKTEKLTLESE